MKSLKTYFQLSQCTYGSKPASTWFDVFCCPLFAFKLGHLLLTANLEDFNTTSWDSTSVGYHSVLGIIYTSPFHRNFKLHRMIHSSRCYWTGESERVVLYYMTTKSNQLTIHIIKMPLDLTSGEFTVLFSFIARFLELGLNSEETDKAAHEETEIWRIRHHYWNKILFFVRSKVKTTRHNSCLPFGVNSSLPPYFPPTFLFWNLPLPWNLSSRQRIRIREALISIRPS